jgi:hypothetical protein
LEYNGNSKEMKDKMFEKVNNEDGEANDDIDDDDETDN